MKLRGWWFISEISLTFPAVVSVSLRVEIDREYLMAT